MVNDQEAENIRLGEQLVQEGISRATEAQARKNLMWMVRAYNTILTVARTQSTVHIDDIYSIFDEKGDHPHAWGGLWRKAVKDGVIESTGMYRKTVVRAKEHHASISPVYRSLLYKGE